MQNFARLFVIGARSSTEVAAMVFADRIRVVKNPSVFALRLFFDIDVDDFAYDHQVQAR